MCTGHIQPCHHRITLHHDHPNFMSTNELTWRRPGRRTPDFQKHQCAAGRPSCPESLEKCRKKSIPHSTLFSVQSHSAIPPAAGIMAAGGDNCPNAAPVMLYPADFNETWKEVFVAEFKAGFLQNAQKSLLSMAFLAEDNENWPHGLGHILNPAPAAVCNDHTDTELYCPLFQRLALKSDKREGPGSQ